MNVNASVSGVLCLSETMSVLPLGRHWGAAPTRKFPASLTALQNPGRVTVSTVVFAVINWPRGKARIHAKATF